MKYLITGGAGFIGSNIADALMKSGNSVVVVDNLSSGNKKNINSSAKFYKLDVTSSKLSDIFEKEKPDIVFHFAAHIEARVSVKDPLNDAKNNIIGGLNVVENCKNYKVKKIIFASSGGEIYGDAKEIPTAETYYPDPISPYGVAKFAIEKYLFAYLRMYGLKFVALRFGNVYGPRQNPFGEAGVVSIFGNKMLKGEQVLIHGSGKQTKDYLFINDAVLASIKLSKSSFVGVINVGTEKETSVLEIFKKIKNLTGYNLKEKHIVMPICGFKRGCLATGLVKKTINWSPEYQIDKGLEITIDWLKENFNGK